MTLSLWETCQKWAEKVFFKSRIYRRFFDFKNVDALDVLADIQNFCGATDLDLKRNKNNDLDALDMARRAGRLEVYQYISKLLAMDEEQKQILATRYYTMQQKNKPEGFK